MPVYIGRVWTDGDPFLLIDAANTAAWAPKPADYEELIVEGVARGATSLDIGTGKAFLLNQEMGEGTLDVFRIAERELLALAVAYAEEPNYDQFLADATAAAPLNVLGALAVRGDAVVFLRSAVPWAEARIEREVEDLSIPTDWEQTDVEALVAAVPPGSYVVQEGRVDTDVYGLDVWRVAAEA